MNESKWTCRCAEHVRVEGAKEGTREEVLDWMKSSPLSQILGDYVRELDGI
ncbi:MAG: hypothetical protein IJQ65_08000 [Kiritimatiellae bacterium]|nr:hypothetical protein [Kiritimatiellia bacterium]